MENAILEKVIIRKAKLQDLFSLQNLIKQLTEKQLTEFLTDQSLNKKEVFERLLSFLKNPSKVIFIAEIEKKIIGFISLQILQPFHLKDAFSKIFSLIVDKNYRNQKIGSSLLKKAEEFSKQNGCKEIELTSSFFRKEAHILYEKRKYLKNPKMYFKKRL